jgi:hypothetical protein
MSKIITLAPAGELAMPLESALSKLPTDAVHNHLHQVAERAKDARTNLEGIELSALILCAVELEDIKKTHQDEVAQKAKVCNLGRFGLAQTANSLTIPPTDTPVS